MRLSFFFTNTLREAVPQVFELARQVNNIKHEDISSQYLGVVKPMKPLVKLIDPFILTTRYMPPQLLKANDS